MNIKHAHQNTKRRSGCDYKTYANLLISQDNRCGICQVEKRPGLPFLAFETTPGDVISGKLVCRNCHHVLISLTQSHIVAEALKPYVNREVGGGECLARRLQKEFGKSHEKTASQKLPE